jgi:two-component system, response regulator PdtaR
MSLRPITSPGAFSPGEAGGGVTPSAASGVMIVEDEFLVAYDLEVALTEAGIAVAGVAGSAGEALELAEAKRPGIAIMDINLGNGPDGIDAALRLFQTYGIRCVFASAHSDIATRRRAEPARPIAWVAKPYSMKTLLEVVKTALADAAGHA